MCIRDSGVHNEQKFEHRVWEKITCLLGVHVKLRVFRIFGPIRVQYGVRRVQGIDGEIDGVVEGAELANLYKHSDLNG